jgi:hypothetical protein
VKFSVAGKMRFFGYFSDEKEAARIAYTKRLELIGDFASVTPVD